MAKPTSAQFELRFSHEWTVKINALFRGNKHAPTRATIPSPHLFYLHDEIELFAADGDESKLSRKLLPIVRQLGQPVTPHRSPHREVDAELREYRYPLPREGSLGQVSEGDVDVIHHLEVQVVLRWSPATPGTDQLLQQRLDGLCVVCDKEKLYSSFGRVGQNEEHDFIQGRTVYTCNSSCEAACRPCIHVIRLCETMSATGMRGCAAHLLKIGMHVRSRGKVENNVRLRVNCILG